jgi:hypothetical protein
MATQPKPKSKGRDYPLSPTPEPMRTDNTSVSKAKPIVGELYPAKPKYSYKYSSENYTKKDSADYKEGYKKGIKTVSSDSTDNWDNKPYKKGYNWIGINERVNSGFSEGKDAVLDKKAKKKK